MPLKHLANAQPLSSFGGKATRLVAVGLSGRAVVASFASAALVWRLATAHRVVVVVERVREVVELACLVVGEPGGATVGRIREDRYTVVFVGGGRVRRVSGVGDRLLLAGRGRRPLGLRLGCWTRLWGAVAGPVCCVSAGGRRVCAGVRWRRKRAPMGARSSPRDAQEALVQAVYTLAPLPI
jgi:hypothetical protein